MIQNPVDICFISNPVKKKMLVSHVLSNLFLPHAKVNRRQQLVDKHRDFIPYLTKCAKQKIRRNSDHTYIGIDELRRIEALDHGIKK